MDEYCAGQGAVKLHMSVSQQHFLVEHNNKQRYFAPMVGACVSVMLTVKLQVAWLPEVSVTR
jgi:hypothetical protein